MEDLTTMMNNGINTLVFKTEKTSTTLNLSLLTEGYDADAKVKLHQCGSTVRLSVQWPGPPGSADPAAEPQPLHSISIPKLPLLPLQLGVFLLSF